MESQPFHGQMDGQEEHKNIVIWQGEEQQQKQQHAEDIIIYHQFIIFFVSGIFIVVGYRIIITFISTAKVAAEHQPRTVQ